ncbi:isoprenoid synthase domain-containing protein [Mycena albidolilacea]|uniref:(2E,6E)-farnesyl diphosphate synthase n=1 Tax=Mycena albidolilacea TaxID=1033008 RepID=A0AAD6YZE6_9AGAR|nr:isoprenoid synthase domain-containing protein [Mycena albidolilacea]
MSESAFSYDNLLPRLASGSSWSPQDELAVLEPFSYIVSNPGEKIRTQLLAMFNIWLNVPQDKLEIIVRVVSTLHNASLMIDDIEDDSQLRRGVPVTHRIYGTAQTINAANYAYFLAYKELLALSGSGADPSPTDLVSIITSELISLHRGQGLELLWRDSLDCPTEDQYINMVNNKTGGFLRIGIKLLMACGTTNVDIDYVPLANLIGVHFQINDDYMNLQSGEYTANKGFAEDFAEGKFSFPIVHGINVDKTNRQLLSTLQKRPRTPTLKRHAISYLEKQTQSFSYTRSVLSTLKQQIKVEIARLGGNEGLEAIINALALKN